MNPDARANFSQQAEWCARLGSPFTALVCRSLYDHLNDRTGFGARLLDWPGAPRADAIALRACGALNALARENHRALAPLYPPNPLPSQEEYWRGAARAIADEDVRLTRFLDRPPQTNEVARSAALLPAYLTVARLTGLPLSLREIGASAGLNLLFDRYFYDYGALSSGSPSPEARSWGAPEAEVTIACEWRGAPCALGSLEIADRRGCDLDPIDAADPVARNRMLAYIWPDQSARLARAEAALRLAASGAVKVEAIDAAAFAARELGRSEPNRALVLAHSIVWQYLPDATKGRLRSAIAEAAKRATTASPFAWVRMEAEAAEARGAVVRLSLWPHGPIDEPLAIADYHGRWLLWRGIE